MEWGRGEVGRVKGMMVGRRGLEGPKMEGMGNGGRFESFLLLVGKVRGERGAGPGK